MQKLRVKIYGERNTGTHYLRDLLQLNLDVKLLRGVVPKFIPLVFGKSDMAPDLYFKVTYRHNLGWKHAMAPRAEDLQGVNTSSMLFLTLSKNPYAWLLSLHKRPYSRNAMPSAFHSFLQAPWQTVGRDKHDDVFPNPIVMWNLKNRSCLELKNFVRSCPVRYEDLLDDPEAFINDIAARFDIARKSPAFVNVTQSTKQDDDKDFDYYRKYYLEQQWKDKLDSAAVTCINSHLDHDLARTLGYEILS